MSVAGSVGSSGTALRQHQNVDENVVVLRDLDAAFYIWESMWKRDQNVFVKFNMLDAIEVKSGEIKLWLFTSTDGLVKSKSRHRFNTDGIMERCIGNSYSSGGKLSAHFSHDGFDWKHLYRKEQLHTVTGAKEKAALVSYGHIYGNTTWLEVTYEIDDAGIRHPKCTTFLLCGSKAMGTALSDDNTSAVPSEKIKSKNKTLNDGARKVMYDLVHLIEARRNTVQVTHIVAVYLCESEEDILDGGSGDGTRTLWLHHTREIFLRPKRSGKSNSNGSVSGKVSVGDFSQYSERTASERRSLACSDVLHNTSSFQRPTKCMGDFCRYSEKEEILIMKTIGTKASSAIAEARKALSRHTKSGVVSALHDGDEEMDMLAEDDEETPMGAEAGTYDAEAIPAVGMARCVPYKSVALARHEMMELDKAHNNYENINNSTSPPQHPSAASSSSSLSQNTVSYCSAEKIWPERLKHWWLRIGKSLAQRRTDNVPDSSSSNSTITISSNIMEKTQQQREKGKGKKLMGHANDHHDGPHRLSQLSEENKTKQPKMVVHMPTTDSPGKSSKSDTSIMQDGGERGGKVSGGNHRNDDDRSVNDMSTIGGASIASAMSKAVPYDLTENSFATNKRKNLGEVSWYYSDARVCEKCYRCYSDLDQRRKHVENKLIDLRRAASNEVDRETEKEREKREFAQRKFTSRISTVKLKKVEGTDNEYTTYVDHVPMPRGKQEGHSFGGGGGGGGGIGFNQHKGHRGTQGGTNGAPRNMLPPMPWQLKDGEKLQKYQEVGSTFIRNIGNKAREAATDAHHMKMVAELERVRQTGGGVLGSILSSMDDNNLHSNHPISHQTHPKPRTHSLPHQYGGEGDPMDVEQQWENVTRGAMNALRARSEGNQQPNPLQKLPHKQQPRSFADQDKALQTTEIKSFNASRLLHPFQRDMEKMRAANELGIQMEFKPGEMSGKEEYTSLTTVNTAPKIVVVKKKTLGDGLGGGGGYKGPNKSHKLMNGGLAGEGGGGGEFYKFDDINRLTGSRSGNPPPPHRAQGTVATGGVNMGIPSGTIHYSTNNNTNNNSTNHHTNNNSSLSSPSKKIKSSSSSSSAASLSYQQGYQQRFGHTTGGMREGIRDGEREGGSSFDGEDEEHDRSADGSTLSSTTNYNNNSNSNSNNSNSNSNNNRSKPSKGVSFAPAQSSGLAAHGPGLDPYKIPPVSGGLGAMYNRAAPSAGGGSGGSVPPGGGGSIGSKHNHTASGGGGGGGYLVRLPTEQGPGLGQGRGPSRADDDDDGEDDDDDGEDDDGIGWSPFVVPSGTSKPSSSSSGK